MKNVRVSKEGLELHRKYVYFTTDTWKKVHQMRQLIAVSESELIEKLVHAYWGILEGKSEHERTKLLKTLR